MLKIDINRNIFEQWSELTVLTPIVQLIESEGAAMADIMCRATYMLEDIRSTLYRMPITDREAEVSKNFVQGQFDLSKIKELRDYWGILNLTKEQNMFKIVSDKYDAMTAYLKELDWADDDGFARSMKIMERLDKIHKALQNAKESMIEAESKSSMKGGAQESVRERRRR